MIIRFCVNVKWIGNPNKHINIEYRNILENYNNTKQINISEYDLQNNPLEVGAIQPLYDRNKSGFKCNQFNWNLAKFYWFDHLRVEIMKNRVWNSYLCNWKTGPKKVF